LKPTAEPEGSVEIDGASARVSFDRHYALARSVVWRALTDADQLARWLDPATVDLRVGGRFDIHFSDAEMHGVITDLIPEHIVEYSWHAGRDDESSVRWELTDEGHGTHVRLVHERLARSSANGFAAGWHHHLERLQSTFDGTTAEWRDGRFEELLEIYRTPVA
jgi:uncharacterized protein YndB with AHSA1/START domain